MDEFAFACCVVHLCRSWTLGWLWRLRYGDWVSDFEPDPAVEFERCDGDADRLCERYPDVNPDVNGDPDGLAHSDDAAVHRTADDAAIYGTTSDDADAWKVADTHSHAGEDDDADPWEVADSHPDTREDDDADTWKDSDPDTDRASVFDTVSHGVVIRGSARLAGPGSSALSG
ncbi:MAG TPA: hypothetical protein VME66_03215 [Candidatus Acidoferrales bacterium]|nr:hypothetical protein [Candidatus Acidoferrales bacterium]